MTAVKLMELTLKASEKQKNIVVECKSAAKIRRNFRMFCEYFVSSSYDGLFL
jgi:hypothetical protein